MLDTEVLEEIALGRYPVKQSGTCGAASFRLCCSSERCRAIDLSPAVGGGTTPAMNAPDGWTRRSLIELALALGLTAPIRVFAQSSTRQPEKLRPQPGDRLVFADGSRQGYALKPADLT